MHHHVTKAVMRLQRRLDRLPNDYCAEQCEQALHLLLNHPDNAAEPSRQVRNALSEARRKLVRRDELRQSPRGKAALRLLATSTRGEGLDWLVGIEIDDFLDRMASVADRRLLRHALSGAGAEGVAAELNLSVERARERLSRARARAFKHWIN